MDRYLGALIVVRSTQIRQWGKYCSSVQYSFFQKIISVLLLLSLPKQYSMYVMILLFCCWPIEYWPWLNENNNHNAKKEIIFKVKKNWITTIKRIEYKQWWYIVYLKNILYCFLSGMFFFDFFQGVFHQEDTTLVAA